MHTIERAIVPDEWRARDFYVIYLLRGSRSSAQEPKNVALGKFARRKLVQVGLSRSFDVFS
jgi:hypothetical protein